METKHTPGPWEMRGKSEWGDHFNVIGTKLGGKYKVARVPFVVYDVSGEKVIDVKDIREARANATLIAAALELLHCAIMSYHILRAIPLTIGIHHDTCKALLRDAIARATGLEAQDVQDNFKELFLI